MKLDVQVCGRAVAQLYRERDEYVLAYLPDTDPADFVSLTMPVREQPWRWPRDLHPFFRQNLPEGYLLSIIREEFGPLLDGTDLSLLALVGGSGVGRVTVTPEGVVPGTDLEPLQIESLLKAENTSAYFSSLVRRYARASISGMVPKFLAPDIGSEQHSHVVGKPTLRTSRHIIKGSDESTPYLGFNEFYTMRVLERLNVVPVAQTRMSDDGRVLIVDRFDVDQQGIATHGVEDACGLLGLPPHEKYAPTMERALNATRVYVPGASVREQLEQFGWHLLSNYVVRNADCHAKNIALYYSSLDDVAYTPIYDIVTTQAYPRFASNPPALAVDGRQTWIAGKALERFFKARLGIAPKQYAQMVERLCESAVEVGKEVIEAAQNEPRWHTVAKHMVHAWNEGMTSLTAVKGVVISTGLDSAIAEARFSAPDRPESSGEAIGRSELLGRPRKK
ncbi:type II toxin-antitoxin system HipA family toxin [Alcaligenes faecalis]|uniref:type II toxin-antitoxin system HipA family toxin n=1 Tax=Alcaligenes TaxID=507 RepID=UPI00052BC514|nr:type II toxin-antitoxin system HipA family toxin [Alcaligenes faecalis]KGP01045.1 toxin HipA [Alcaligenes faecalis]MCM2559650.1 type II toxin-antitoxin system HipA family toxin [Alcaligenes faecalis]MCM2622324.1 type II toxin-antitoxin system HipA family toxin [Alcaligenes faecalis]MDK7587643.1 type II toxin-antitoxin system HipA family toxin [Alcaligenes phenolicus]